MAEDKFKAVPAAYLMLVDQGKILLLKRSKKKRFGGGQYSLVAGHIEDNENPAQAMVREAKEEAGIELLPQDLRVAHLMYRQKAFQDNLPYVDFFLLCERWRGEIQNMEPEKCEELRWVPMDDLPSETMPQIRQVIECFRRNEFYSEYGWNRETSA